MNKGRYRSTSIIDQWIMKMASFDNIRRSCHTRSMLYWRCLWWNCSYMSSALALLNRSVERGRSTSKSFPSQWTKPDDLGQDQHVWCQHYIQFIDCEPKASAKAVVLDNLSTSSVLKTRTRLGVSGSGFMEERLGPMQRLPGTGKLNLGRRDRPWANTFMVRHSFSARALCALISNHFGSAVTPTSSSSF